ncbi:hypothetical protein QR680_018979 [Steinernema hermaphroditum]|uniref:Uncharacterized protein n=1 Tax=Steinernema hermaphroditum TaxID=289476 RepID=A0AA39HKL1_9BILA|nr:hypothetical protein QR680_018979 [Steinernema hermaphroditum]
MNADRKDIKADIDADDSSQLSMWDKGKLIDQLMEERRMLKHYLHKEQQDQEPESDDLYLDLVLRLNRAVTETLCTQVGRSFDVDGKKTVGGQRAADKEPTKREKKHVMKKNGKKQK